MRLSVVLVLTAALAGLAPRIAAADTAGPDRTYLEPAQDGRLVFVMIAPPPRYKRLPGDEETAEELSIRARYSKSGMYPAGSDKPMWTVGWYASRVEVASDGVHLIRYGGWPGNMHDRGLELAPRALAQEALSFFANGRLLKTYSIGDLVDTPDRLPQSVSHFRWCSAAVLDDAQMELIVATLDGNRFVFDVKTGAVMSKTQTRAATTTNWVYVAIGVGATVFAILAALFVRRFHSVSRSRNQSNGGNCFGTGSP